MKAHRIICLFDRFGSFPGVQNDEPDKLSLDTSDVWCFWESTLFPHDILVNSRETIEIRYRSSNSNNSIDGGGGKVSADRCCRHLAIKGFGLKLVPCQCQPSSISYRHFVFTRSITLYILPSFFLAQCFSLGHSLSPPLTFYMLACFPFILYILVQFSELETTPKSSSDQNRKNKWRRSVHNRKRDSR